MDPFQQLVYSQRPDVQGHPVNDWWQLWGANEMRNKLAALGRQDVLQHVGSNNNLLRDWYQLWGSQEYPNIWQAAPAAPAAPATPPRTAAQEYGAIGAEQAPNANIPQWQNAVSWEGLKSQFEPYFNQAAEYYVAPEVQRNYRSASRDYMNQLASSGGGRFGRGIGGTGTLAAQAQRSLAEQMRDYINQYNTALKSGWYDPIGEQWNQARESGKTFEYTAPKASDYTGYSGVGLGSQYQQNAQFMNPIYGTSLGNPSQQVPVTTTPATTPVTAPVTTPTLRTRPTRSSYTLS